MSPSTPVRCLVVDDDPGMRTLARAQLELVGGEVTVAASVAQAAAALAEDDFAMVVVDRNLRSTHLGTEVLAMAGRTSPAPALFLISAHVDAAVEAEARAVGAVAVDKLDLLPILEAWAALQADGGLRWWEVDPPTPQG